MTVLFWLFIVMFVMLDVLDVFLLYWLCRLTKRINQLEINEIKYEDENV